MGGNQPKSNKARSTAKPSTCGKDNDDMTEELRDKMLKRFEKYGPYEYPVMMEDEDGDMVEVMLEADPVTILIQNSVMGKRAAWKSLGITCAA